METKHTGDQHSRKLLNAGIVAHNGIIIKLTGKSNFAFRVGQLFLQFFFKFLLSAKKDGIAAADDLPLQNQTITQEDPIPFTSLFPFFLITFGITWGVIAFYVFVPEPMVRLFGQLTGSHPLFYLAVWSPGIVAFIIIFINNQSDNTNNSPHHNLHLL